MFRTHPERQRRMGAGERVGPAHRSSMRRFGPSGSIRVPRLCSLRPGGSVLRRNRVHAAGLCGRLWGVGAGYDPRLLPPAPTGKSVIKGASAIRRLNSQIASGQAGPVAVIFDQDHLCGAVSCCGRNGSSSKPSIAVAPSLVAGSGPRPSAKARSSMRAPRNRPGRA
jgi:hypothetical protein